MMNKFLHPTLQAIKAAAAEGDTAKLETLRGTFDRKSAVYTSAHVSRSMADADAEVPLNPRSEEES
jgi:hypothetical protein